MTDEDFKQGVLDELKAIRKLLETGPRSAPSTGGLRAMGGSGGSSGDAVIPQPTSLIDEPGCLAVHFGKNNGVALDKLSERSLSFYASVKEPRLGNDGRPFPPRPQDVALENAARQLWHQNKGTLQGSAPQRHAPPPRAGATTAVEDGGDVPFAARYYDHG